MGLQITLTNGDDEGVVNNILNDFIKNIDNIRLKILIDYSCMTRIWYSEILSFFYSLISQKIKEIEIDFVYSFGKFRPSTDENFRNLHVDPIEGFSSFSIPDKPTALIIGLGYEKNKAFGLAEYFDAKTYLYYNNDNKSRRFSNEVKQVNRDLINDLPEGNITLYSIRDVINTERQLYSLCDFLKQDFRVIIAPTGPKPFTIVSLVVALKLGEIDVWRISQGNNRRPSNVVADGEILVYRVILTDAD